MLDQRYSDDQPSRRDIPSFIEPRPPLIQNPFMRPRPQKGTNLLELFEEDSELEEPELVQVYLRLKPCTDRSNLYEVRSDRCLVTSLDTATAGHGRRTQHNISKMYTFSRIFRPDSTQKEIFEQVVKDNLKKLPDGQSFTLLTYGASGSGKTYTLMGTVSSPGLVPRSLEYVFKLVDAAQQPLYKPGESGAEKLSLAEQDFELQWVKRLRHVSAPLRDKYRRMSAQLYNDMTISSVDLTNRTRYYVWVSFVEIYNEAIYDLLSPPDKRVKLRLREDSTGNVYVKGVTQAFVRSGEEAYDVMVAGRHNLVVAATGVHAQSSRSHCIFTITMLTEIDGSVRWSTVRLCDLAGCERARATRNTGARMQESRAINSSLHVLERCLHTLRRRQRHAHPSRPDALVPYRESKLTRLLGSGLSGTRGEAVSMVVTLNPSPEYAHETKHVLTLAAVAQDIQINNTMCTTTLESSTHDTTIESSAEVMRLRSENERLHFELVQAQARNKELMASMEARQQEAADTMRELVEEAKDLTRQYYEAQLQALRTEMEDMMEEYESKLAKNAAPPTDAGTPSRFLQAKVAELMTEIAVLEEKLTAEHLARARAEKEVQHLRDCIEERDEKAFKENGSGSQEEIMSFTDSEHESDEENDIFNESLEPVFKKENLNKSQIIQKDEVIQNIVDRVENEEEEYNKSSDTLKDDSLNDKTEDSAYAAGDDESELSKDVDDSSQSLVNVNSTVDKNDTLKDDEIKDKTRDLETDICNNDVIEEKDIKNEEVLVKTSKPDLRGTYCVQDDELKSDIITEEEFKKPTLLRGTYFVKETDKVKSPNNVLKSNHNRHITSPFKSDTVKSNLDEQKAMKKAPEKGSDSSLRQFELLEIEANACDETKNDAGDFGKLNFFKEKRTYFEDEKNSNKVPTKVDKVKLIFENRDNESSQEFPEFRNNKEKRTYFDNINVNVDLPSNKKITDIVTKNTDDRSPSIVKEYVGNDFEPSTIKKLLGESLTKTEFISSVQKNNIIKKHDSVDIFEGYDSPHISKPKYVENDCNNVTKSVEKLKLVEEDQVNIKTEIKLEAFSSIDVPVIEESKPEEILPTRIDNALTELTNVNNTIDEFENICKDITSSRATEFDLLVSQEVSTVENKDDNKQNDVEDEPKQIQLEVEKVKYNLRNKLQSKNDKSGCNEGDVILAESQQKCESKLSTKRNLRLRRRKNAVDEELEEVKLKNIVNLQKEFSDVTMDMPATKKEVKDIPSPEKCDEEENVPPLLGIQSCPSKSVTRSRRKLFTPRAEPLDESLPQTGDSNERIRVPRPSYHRARARRKL